jgi:hypothetical protein
MPIEFLRIFAQLFGWLTMFVVGLTIALVLLGIPVTFGQFFGGLAAAFVVSLVLTPLLMITLDKIGGFTGRLYTGGKARWRPEELLAIKSARSGPPWDFIDTTRP